MALSRGIKNLILFKTMNNAAIRIFSLFSFFILGKAAFAQCDQTIKLQEPTFKITPLHYHLQTVIDRRKNTGNNGKILSVSGKILDVKFTQSTENSVLKYCEKVLVKDSTLIPIQIAIDKLQFKDIGSAAKHTLTLEIKLSIIRTIEGKEFELYGTNGSPSFISQGVTPGLAEKLVQQSIDALLKGFDEYANSNSAQQTFCDRTETIFVYDNSYTDYENSDTIRWKSDYKLNWSDFQGSPDPGSSFSAQSNCMFSYKSSIEYKAGVMRISLFLFPCFTKKASWVIAKNQQEGLLNHEQLHFDICELYIRKLRKKISETELTILDPGSQIRTAFEQAWTDYQSAQSQYDEETRHGLIEKDQKRWEKNIVDELRTYEEFATR